jgi:aminocarboxymuconate-semialdehyde decarboxylase
LIVDVHAHLYPRAFMEEIATRGPRHGVSLTADSPPVLCFEGIRFWAYAPAFHDVTVRLKAMDEAGCDRQVLSLGPPMVYWADAELGLRLSRIFNDEIARVMQAHPDRFVGFAAVPLKRPYQRRRGMTRSAKSRIEARTRSCGIRPPTFIQTDSVV